MYAEACLSGVPSISTKVGLPLMGISNYKNGLFIERDINSLQEKIIEVYDNRDLLKKLALNVKKDYLEWMDNQKTIHHLIQMLEEKA